MNDGIRAGDGSTVSHNSVSSNGDDGIECLSACSVVGNSASNNADFGFEMGSDVGWVHNVAVTNNGGKANPQVSGGIELGENICGTDAICP